MPRALNLLDNSHARAKQRWGGRMAAAGLLALVGVAAMLTAGLQALGRRAQADSSTLRQQAAPLQAQSPAASAPPAASQELARLRRLDEGQGRIRAALDSGLAGASQGHAEYLVALARQASSQVWLTGFAVSEDGGALELEGRMAEPGALPAYLRTLNAEPRFKGRPFAQLSLNAVALGGEAALPYTEFALRSQVAAGKARP